MKWIEAKISFDTQNPVLLFDLISNIFFDMGLKGVSQEDPNEEPDEGWGDDAARKPDATSVSGYFPFNVLDDQKRMLLETRMAELAKDHHITYRIAYHELHEEDWAESWKKYFQPEKITDTIVVKPTWREYDASPDELVIEIDPGMAFGTGTHPTTSLCMMLIEKHITPGDHFLDVGTGSGILMILAAFLGAKKVTGIDTDEIAVTIAEKNLMLNNIPPDVYQVAQGNLVETVGEKFNLITANILSEVILVLLDTIKQVMAENSILICSGIIEENAGSVVEKMKTIGLTVRDVVIREKWAAVVAVYHSEQTP